MATSERRTLSIALTMAGVAGNMTLDPHSMDRLVEDWRLR